MAQVSLPLSVRKRGIGYSYERDEDPSCLSAQDFASLQGHWDPERIYTQSTRFPDSSLGCLRPHKRTMGTDRDCSVVRARTYLR